MKELTALVRSASRMYFFYSGGSSVVETSENHWEQGLANREVVVKNAPIKLFQNSVCHICQKQSSIIVKQDHFLA